MGIALILLGLLAAGIVVDFAAENWSAGTADLTFALFGGSFTLTQMQVVLSAAVLGAVAVALCIVGAGLLRGSRGRRRTVKRRIADLERENTALKQRRVSEPDREAHSDDRTVIVESQR
jgi:uncharacterized integral membrane protein